MRGRGKGEPVTRLSSRSSGGPLIYVVGLMWRDLRNEAFILTEPRCPWDVQPSDFVDARVARRGGLTGNNRCDYRSALPWS
jgi:hypothetical protein